VRSVVSALVLAFLAAPPLPAQSLSAREREIRAVAQREREQAVSFLQKVVDIDSGTLNLGGVGAVGDAFARELGAVFEAARTLDEFRRTLPEQYLTFNPGVIAGGERLDYETAKLGGTVGGKLNIIAPTAVVQGDLRFITEAQKDRARAKMREIVAKHLPGTTAEISFADGYPAMSPTAGNRALLAQLETVSRALGYGPVEALDPGRRGAGDISFVAPFIDGLDGLGVSGRGAHAPDEDVNLESVHRATERAALLIYRLTQAPRAAKVAQ
jgi:acetylornithine deacetylase/succinyl-diaminopimelate desuccinylase-like protein